MTLIFRRCLSPLSRLLLVACIQRRLLGRPWPPAFAKKADISSSESKNKEKDLE